MLYYGGEEVEVVKLKLYYNSKQHPQNDPANQGFSEAMDLLAVLESQGIHCDRIDTVRLPNEKVYEAYADAWTPSVSRKFAIRRVFGTRRRSGCYFGREVPALLVYEDSNGDPIDVYPHEKLGRTVTIKDFLKGLLTDSNLAD